MCIKEICVTMADITFYSASYKAVLSMCLGDMNTLNAWAFSWTNFSKKTVEFSMIQIYRNPDRIQ